ncbi:MAG: KEOPS complex subunit Pcc1 [Candidatus Micrarchaeia archaeon]
MEYACTIELPSADPAALCRALTFSEPYERSEAAVVQEGGKVFIKIRAKDISALRASVNDYLRLAKACSIEGCVQDGK